MQNNLLLTKTRPTAPTVSAITIFFNAETFIAEAIESVLSQTFSDWELILVDDGSTDKSTEIAQRYAQKYPQQILYCEHPNRQNKGMSAARSLGISLAKGHYIAFLDADDIWLPKKLEHQVAILDSHPKASMVFNPSKRWYSWTGQVEDSRRDWIETVSDRTNTLIEPPALFLASMLEQRVQSASTCSLLIRKEILEELGGFEQEFRGLYEDQVFLTKVYAQKPIYVTNACLDLYRQHPNSCVALASNKKQQSTARLRFLTWVKTYLLSQKIENPILQKALNEAIWPHQHPWRHRFQETVVPIGRSLLPTALREWLWQHWSRQKQLDRERA